MRGSASDDSYAYEPSGAKALLKGALEIAIHPENG
jgi:hypothetical protein